MGWTSRLQGWQTWRGGLVGLAALGTACATAQLTALPMPDAARSAPLDPLEVPDPDIRSVRAAPGYRIEAVVTGLTYPSSVEVDDEGFLYVAEAGAVWGDLTGRPRILRVSPDGEVRLLTDRLVAPVSDLLWHDGELYVSHRGRISAVSRDGAVRNVVTGLPSLGDHTNTQLTVGPDGRLYFGQGTVTNAGVVGLDNFFAGWLPEHPTATDRPARDILVRDATFRSTNPFAMADPGAPHVVRTAPFAAFGATHGADEKMHDGFRILAHERATGCVYRCNLDGSALEVYAWGLRNPAGVLWGNDGQLYASNQGMQERGLRPVANAPDDLLLVKQNGWYGWPDFVSGVPVTDPRFRSRYGADPQPIMINPPGVDQPLLTFAPQTGVAKLARAPNGNFGDPRHLFMAVSGDFNPASIVSSPPGGPRIVRIDPLNRRVEPFVGGGDEGVLDQGLGRQAPGRARAGLRRPVDVTFTPRGDALYVADLGVIEVQSTRIPTVRPYPGTGVVWRVVPLNVRARPEPGISFEPLRVDEAAK
ncbi:MAG: PQQ-dependent sugar dehydrogenase [Planctomycetes bacterium]|nr:PQQ-dependent sugar dehydrogenase [Planctomycetota bacterium]